MTSQSRLTGAVTTLTYTSGRLASVSDANGRTLTYAYNAGGLVSSVTGPSGRQALYGYTGTDLTQVTDPSGAVTAMTYDSSHRLLTMTNPRSKVTTMTYDTTGRVATQAIPGRGSLTWAYQPVASDGTSSTTVTDSHGSQSVFNFTNNVLTSQTAAAGTSAAATTSYVYADSLQPASVTDPRGNVTSFTYDGHGNVVLRTDANNHTSSFGYNATDDLTSSITADGTTTYGRDTDGLLTSVTDPLNQKTLYTNTARGEVASVTTPANRVATYTYDTAGNRATMTTPAGEKTSYAENASGWVTSSTTPRGNVSGASAATIESYTTHDAYDADGRLTSMISPRDTTRVTTYDGVGNAVEDKATSSSGTVLSDVKRTFDAGDQLLTVTNTDHQELTDTYDAVGNLATSTDGSGATTSYTYDARNRRATMTTARGNVSGASAATQAAYTWSYGYDLNSNQTTVTDPASRVSATGYDPVNQPTTSTTSANNTTTTGYDALGRVVSVKNPLGATSTYSYDAAGRLSGTAGPGGTYTVSYGRDADGLVTSVTKAGGKTTYTYDTDGRLATTVDPLGNVSGGTPANYTTTLGYDLDGDQVTVKNQLGRTTTSTFDAEGDQLTSKTPRASVTKWTYDGLDRAATIADPDNRVTKNTFDKYGDLTGRTDPQSHTLTYGYDLRHLLTSQTDQLGRTRKFGYDPEGNLTSTIDARGTVAGATAATIAMWTVNQTYDARDLRTGVSNSADPSVNATFGYDAEGHMNQFTDSTATGTTATTNLGYDTAGQLTSVAGPEGSYSYGYNPNGTVSQRTLPASGTVSYTYNANDQVATQVADSATTSYAYDADQQLTTLTYPTSTGLVETRGYDRTGAMVKVLNKKSSTVLSQYDYTLDTDANPTAIKTTRGTTATSATYTYDAAEQVTKYCPGATTCTSATAYVGYTYDPLGDLTQQNRVGVTSPGTTTNVYDNAGERTSSTDPTNTAISYTYDADGNLTSGGRTWDALNRMTAIGTGTAKTSFTYSALGLRRTLTPATGNPTSYSWDINNPLPQQGVITRPDGSTWASRYDPTGSIQNVHATAQTYADSYLLHDRLGSITDVAGPAGAPEWSYAYEPFGTRTSTKINATATDPNYGYTGQYLEPTTGEYNLRARDYAPTDATFHATDPLTTGEAVPEVSAGIPSPYAYVGNNPLVNTDPSGLCFGPDFICAAAQFEAGGAAAIFQGLADHGTQAGEDLVGCGDSAHLGYGGAAHQCFSALDNFLVGGASEDIGAATAGCVHATNLANCLRLGLDVAAIAGICAEGAGGISGAIGRTGEVAHGGISSVLVGQAGETAVRGSYNIGPKATVQIGDRTRIFDGLNSVAVSEVKNVKYQAFTQQLKDSLAYAQQNGLAFDLYVRGGANPTILSKPLEAAIRNGDIQLKIIP